LSPDDISGDEGELRKPRTTGSNNILCQNEPEPEDDHLLDASFQTIAEDSDSQSDTESEEDDDLATNHL
jgi:hypothetical protein